MPNKVDWSKGVRGRFKGVKRIEFAESTQVNRRRESVDRLLRAMGEVAWSDWRWETVLVTDLSSVGDFLREDSELAALGEKLGFKVGWRDLLIDVALRLEPKQ